MQDLFNDADDILRGIGFSTRSLSSNTNSRNLSQRLPARFFKKPSVANEIISDSHKAFDPLKSQEIDDFSNKSLPCSKGDCINTILEYLLSIQEDDEKIPATDDFKKISIVNIEDNTAEKYINKESNHSKLLRIGSLKERFSEKFSDNQAFSFINNYLQENLNNKLKNPDKLKNFENSEKFIENLKPKSTNSALESNMHKAVYSDRHKKDSLKWSISAPVYSYQQSSNQSVRPILRQTPKGTYYWTILQPSNFTHLESNGYYDTMPSVEVPESYNTSKVDSNNTLLNVKKLLIRLLQLSNVPVNLIEDPDLHSERIRRIPKRFFKKPSIDRQKDTLLRSYSESQLDSNVNTQHDVDLKEHMPSTRERTLMNKSLLLESKFFNKIDPVSLKSEKVSFTDSNSIDRTSIDEEKRDSIVSESTSTAETSGWSISESSGSVAKDYELEKYYSSKNLLKIPTNDNDDSASCHSDRTATNENERFFTTLASLDDEESGIYNNNIFNILDSVEDGYVMPGDSAANEQATKKRPKMREIRSLKVRQNLEISHNRVLTRQRSSQSDSSGYADGEFTDSFSFFHTSQQEGDKLSPIEDEVSDMPPTIVTEACSTHHTPLEGENTVVESLSNDINVRSIFHFGNMDDAYELGKEITLLVTPGSINTTTTDDDVFLNSEFKKENNDNQNEEEYERNARLCLQFKNSQYKECDYSAKEKNPAITDNKSELNLIYKNRTYSCGAKNKSFSLYDRKLQNIRPQFFRYTGENIDFNNNITTENNNSTINNKIKNVGYDVCDNTLECANKLNSDRWLTANKDLTRCKSQDKKCHLTRQRSFTDTEMN